MKTITGSRLRGYHFSIIIMFFGSVITADPVIDPTRADLSFQPTIDHTNTGVPVVNINTPSAGGVSRNQYQDFDVSPHGLILNNSKNPGSSKIGGRVNANSHLSNGTAQVIVNEVRGLSDSQLNGVTEIFGDNADIVIANPNGVTCRGCDFINSNQVTLTTGTPNFDNNNLSFDVDRGTVRIEGQGLKGEGGVDQVNLIGHRVHVNAPVSANKGISVGAGNLNYNYTKSKESGSLNVSGGNKSPNNKAYAIDGSVYGAMRAGKIDIVVTNAGEGVRIPGYLSATIGKVNITAKGDVELRGTEGATGINIKTTGDIRQKKDMVSGGDITIDGMSFTVDANGALQSAGNVAVNANQNVAISGKTQINKRLNIIAGGNLRLNHQAVIGEKLSIDVKGNVDLGKGRIDAPQMVVTAGGSVLSDETLITVKDDMDFQSAAIAFLNNTVVKTNTLSVESKGDFDSQSSWIEITNNADIHVGTNFTNSEGSTLKASDLALDVKGQVINNDAIILADEKLDIKSISLNNLGEGVIQAGELNLQAITENILNEGQIASQGDLNINLLGGFENTGSITSKGSLALVAKGLISHSGILRAQEELAINSNVSFINDGVLSGQAINLAITDNFVNKGQVLSTKDNIEIKVSGNYINDGEVGSSADILIIADDIDNKGKLYAKDDTSVIASNLVNSGTILTVLGSIDLDLTNDLNNLETGVILAGSNLDLHTRGNFLNQGDISSITGEMNLDIQGDFHNENTKLVSGSSLVLDINGSIYNNNGEISAKDGITLTAMDTIDNSFGLISTNGVLNINSKSLIQTLGSEIYGGDVNISVSGYLINPGKIISKGDLNLLLNGELVNSGTINADDKFVSTGLVRLINNNGLIQVGSMTLDLPEEINNNNGAILSSGDLQINISSLSNDGGIIQSDSNAALMIRSDFNNNGLLSANNALQLNVTGELFNSGEIKGGDSSNIVVSSNIQNIGLIQLSQGSINTTNDIVNEGGSIQGDKLVINSDKLSNLLEGGIVVEALTVNSTTLYNDTTSFINTITSNFLIKNSFENNGEIQSSDNLHLTASTLDNKGLLLSSGSLDAIIRGDISNDGVMTANRLKLTTQGNITNTNIISGEDIVELKAGNNLINNAGLIQSKFGNLALEAIDIQNIDSGIIQSSADISIIAQAGLSNTHKIISSGALSIQVSQTLKNSGEILSTSNLSLIANNVENSNAVIASNAAINIQSTGAINNTQGEILSANEGTISATFFNNKQGTLIGDSLRLTFEHINNQEGEILAEHSLGAFVSGGVDNTNGNIQGGAIRLTVGTSLNNNSGIILAKKTGIKINAHDLQNIQSGSIEALQDISINVVNTNNEGLILSGNAQSINAEGSFNNTGTVESLGNLEITSASLQNNNVISTRGNMSLNVSQLLNNTHWIVAGGSANILANKLHNDAGYIETAGTSRYTVADISNQGTIISLGDINIAGNTYSNSNLATLYTAGSLTLVESSDVENHGIITAKGDVNANIEGGVVNSGEWVSGNTFTLIANKGIQNSGIISVFSDLIIEGQEQLDNTNGWIEVLGQSDITLLGDILNKNGVLKSTGNLNIESSSINNSQGDIVSESNGNITALTGDINNTNGRILTTSDLVLVGGASLINTNGIVSGDSLTANLVADINNDKGLILSHQAININAQQLNNTNDGIVQSLEGTISIDLNNSLDNQGIIQATQAIDFNVAEIIKNDGLILTESSLNVQGKHFIQRGIMQSGADTRMILAGDFTNQNSVIEVLGDLNQVVAGDWVNNNASIVVQGTSNIQAVNVKNINTALFKTDALVINTTGNLDNLESQILVNKDLNLSITGYLNNTAGEISTNTASLSVGSDLINTRGTILSSEALNISVSGSLIDQNDGVIISGSNLNLNIGDDFDLQGSIQSLQDLALTVGGNYSANTGQLVAHGDLNLSVSGNVQQEQSIINSGGLLTLSASSINNNNESLISGITTQITLTGDLNNQNNSAIVATELLTMVLDGSLINSHENGVSSLITANVIDFDISESISNAGDIKSATDFTIKATNFNTSVTGISQSGNDNKITLTGSMNNQGEVTALGSFSLDTNQSLVNSGLIGSYGLMTLVANDVNSSGVLLTNDNFVANIVSDFIHTGQIEVDKSLTINTGSTFNNSGFISSTEESVIDSNAWIQSGTLQGNNIQVTMREGNSSGLIVSDSDIHIQGASLAHSGQMVAKNDINLVLSDEINNSGLLQASNDISITANSLNTTDTSITVAGNDIEAELSLNANLDGNIQAKNDVIVNATASISNAGFVQGESLTFTANLIKNDQGVLLANNQVTLQADTIKSLNNSYIQGNVVTLEGATKVSNEANSAILANQLMIVTQTLENLSSDISANTLTLSISDGIRNSGNIIGNDLLTISPLNYFDNRSGRLSGASIYLTVKGDIKNTSGVINSSSNVQIQTANLYNGTGTIFAADNTQISASGAVSGGGQITGISGLSIDAQSINNTGAYASQGAVKLVSNSNISHQGSIHGSTVSLAAPSSITGGGSISSASSISLNASTIGISGQLQGGDINSSSSSFSNAGGMTASGSLNISAINASNSGTLSASNTSLVLSGVLSNTGLITSSNSTTVSGTTDIINDNGQISSGNSLNLTASNLISNRGGMLYANGDMSLNANELNLKNLVQNETLSESDALGRVFGDDTDATTQNQINTILSGLDGLDPSDPALAAAQNNIAALLPDDISGDRSSVLTKLMSMQSTSPNADYTSIAESTIYAAGNLNVAVVNELFIEGDVTSGGNMSLTTGGDLLNGGRINAGGDGNLTTTGFFKNDTTLADYASTDGELFVGADGKSFGDRVYANFGGHLAVNAPSGIENNNADLQVLGNLIYNGDETSVFKNMGDATLLVGNTLTVNTGVFHNETDASMTLNVAAVQAIKEFTNEGKITSDIFAAKGNVDTLLSIKDGNLQGTSAISLNFPGWDVDTADSLPLESLTALGLLEIRAKTFTNSVALQAGGTLKLDILEGPLLNDGTLIAKGDLLATFADGDIINNGTIGSGQTLQLTSKNNLINNGALISGSNMLLFANTANNGEIRAGSNLIVNGSLTNNGQQAGPGREVYKVVHNTTTTVMGSLWQIDGSVSLPVKTEYRTVVKGNYPGAIASIIKAGGNILVNGDMTNSMSLMQAGGSIIVDGTLTNESTPFTGKVVTEIRHQHVVLLSGELHQCENCTEYDTRIFGVEWVPGFTEQPYTIDDQTKYHYINNETALITSGNGVSSNGLHNTGVIRSGGVAINNNLASLFTAIDEAKPNTESIFNNLFNGTVSGGTGGSGSNGNNPGDASIGTAKNTKDGLNQAIIRLVENYQNVDQHQQNTQTVDIPEASGVKPVTETVSIDKRTVAKETAGITKDIKLGGQKPEPEQKNPDNQNLQAGTDVVGKQGDLHNIGQQGSQAVAHFVDGVLVTPSSGEILQSYGIPDINATTLASIDTRLLKGSIIDVLALNNQGSASNGDFTNGLDDGLQQPPILEPNATIDLSKFSNRSLDLRGVDQGTLDFLGLGYSFENNYLAAQLGVDVDPNALPEQYAVNQLLEQALLKETAQAYLSNEWNNDEEQLQGLYDNAVKEADAQGFTYGEILTTEQIAALESPILWNVKDEKTGKIKAVLYLPEDQRKSLAVDNTGVIESTRAIAVNTTGKFKNTGFISSDSTVAIKADTIINKKRVVKVETIYKGDTSKEWVYDPTIESESGDGMNYGGMVYKDVTETYKGKILEAQRGGVIHGKDVQLEATGKGKTNLFEKILRFWGYENKGKGKVINQGGTIIANKDIVIKGKNGVINNANKLNRFITETDDNCEGTCGDKATTFQSANISAGGSIRIQSNKNINNIGSDIAAQGNVILDAVGDINNKTISTQYMVTDVNKSSWFGLSRDKRKEYAVDMSISNIISTQGNVILKADGDLNNTGARITALQTIQGTIKGDINLKSQIEEVENYQFSRGLSGLSYGQSKNKSNAFYQSDSQLLANNINLQSETGDINAQGALLAAAETAQLVAQDGDVNLKAQTNEKYSETKGWSIGVSFGGSKIVDAALKGGSMSDLMDAYAQSNEVAGALNSLANSDGNQTRQALINASISAKSAGKELISAFGQGKGVEAFTNKLNPFADSPLSGNSKGVSISFGSFKNSSKWDESTRTQVFGGKNIIVEANGKGTLNVEDGTVLSTRIDDIADKNKNNFAEGSLLYEIWGKGDQYKGDKDKGINLTGAQGINILALEEHSATKSSSFGGSVGIGAGGITVGINGSKSNSNGTSYTNALIETDGQVSLSTDKDVNIKGGNINADNVNYDIKGDLNVESVQDSSESSNSSFGLTVSQAGIENLSISKGSGNSASVNQQSGIHIQNGQSGSIGGDINLTGGFVADESGNANVDLGGTINTTDINNQANATQSGISAGFTGNSPSLGLPTHSNNDTNSITHSVIKGISFTNPDGTVVDTSGIRNQLEGANEALADPNAQDNNALGILAGTIVSTELTQAIGDYSANQDAADRNTGWQEGGTNKIILHTVNGALTNILTGGSGSDSLSSGLAAGATEALMPTLSTGNAGADKLIAGLLGGTVANATGGSFDSGAIAGGIADGFNRQLHPTELKLIDGMVDDFREKAKDPNSPIHNYANLSDKEIIAFLTQSALNGNSGASALDTNSVAASTVGNSNVGIPSSGFNNLDYSRGYMFLKEETAGDTFTDESGVERILFTNQVRNQETGEFQYSASDYGNTFLFADSQKDYSLQDVKDYNQRFGEPPHLTQEQFDNLSDDAKLEWGTAVNKHNMTTVKGTLGLVGGTGRAAALTKVRNFFKGSTRYNISNISNVGKVGNSNKIPDQVTYKINPDLTPQVGTRATAINRAWKQEQELVILTGKGTRNWTKNEIQELINTGKVDGYTGHHRNNVAQYPDWKGDPRNIDFLSNTPNGGDHLNSLQGHNNNPNSTSGNYQNSTNGRLIDREAMINRAINHAK